MAWFRKKADPISERARALNAEIAQLEAQIRNLDSQLAEKDAEAGPAEETGAVEPVPVNPPGPAAKSPRPAERKAVEAPVFEKVDLARLETRAEALTTPAHYNELGVRKYDLPALFRRLRNHFRGPSTTNPKLVSYLAAGGIQGLRPLRYERRVARNRFIFLVGILFLILLGLVAAFVRRN